MPDEFIELDNDLDRDTPLMGTQIVSDDAGPMLGFGDVLPPSPLIRGDRLMEKCKACGHLYRYHDAIHGCHATTSCGCMKAVPGPKNQK